MQFLFFLITSIFQMGINKKIPFNKHFARKYIRAYTNWANCAVGLTRTNVKVNVTLTVSYLSFSNENENS